MLTTYHTHSLFCDGKLMPEDYILTAISKGFTAIGISSHAPVCFETDWTMKPEKMDDYMHSVLALKEKYRGKLQIYAGLETDYYPGCRDYRKYPGLDYTIGSVHFIHHQQSNQYMALDGTHDEFIKTRDIVFDGEVRYLIEKYYTLLIEMVQNQTPDILGHLDIIKKNNKGNRFFNEFEPWYREAVEQALDVIQKQNVIVEINTGGISRGYTTELYPSDWILAAMRQRDIPVMLNSDAHHPDTIDVYYPQAREKLKSAGYTQQRILLDNSWQNVPL